MWRKRALALALAGVFGAGCANLSEGQQQALGALTGAAVGGATCQLVGGNTGECLAVAAGGAVLGWAAVKTKQVLDRREDLPPSGSTSAPANPTVVIRDYRLQPATIQPGQALVATTLYDLRTPPQAGPRPVTQTFRVLKDGKEIGAFTPVENQLKEHGRYEVGWEIPVPGDAAPGQYQLVQTLDAKTASPEQRIASFTVTPKVAWYERLLPGRG